MYLGRPGFGVNGHGKAGRVPGGWNPHLRVLGARDSSVLTKVLGLNVSSLVSNNNNTDYILRLYNR